MKKVLGRGLEALIPQELRESVSETERVKELGIDQIDPNPNQPRVRFETARLKELAESIKQNGLLQPVMVKRNGKRYQLVLGERRLKAARMAGLASIPAIVRDLNEEDCLKYALMENLQREDLNPIEEAMGYKALREKFGLSVKEIASMLGRDRSTVANSLRLLRLPESVRRMLEDGKLTAGHARAILALDGEDEQVRWAERVAEEGITVREVEKGSGRGRVKSRSRRRLDPQMKALEERLEMHLGTRVIIAPKRRGGLIRIEYYSNEELEGLLAKLGVIIDL